MAGFNAAEAVEKLDWNFDPFVADAKGTVPEPSTEKVGAFFDQLHLILDRPGDDEDDKGTSKGDDKIVALMEQMSADQMLFVDDKLIAAFADLCGDSPAAEQLRALPHRQRQAFFGWITRQVTDPT